MSESGSSSDAARADGGRLKLWWRSILERFRSSLFGVPSLWIAASVVVWWIAGTIDRAADWQSVPWPLTTTVDSARALLGAVASGTIAAASVVFSLTLVAIQLSSSSYSSRVLRTLLRDRFQQHMIGIVLGTFFFSLLVLREVHGPLEEGGDPYVPTVSVALATWFALAAILALLASISHTAQSVRVSRVSSKLVAELREVIEERLDPEHGSAAPFDVQSPGLAPSPIEVAVRGQLPDPPQGTHGVGGVVTSLEGGWVQQISVLALGEAVDEGSTVRIEVAVGTYVYPGALLATVWPAPAPEVTGESADAVRSAIAIGWERTLQQDIDFGLTMIEDIALRALSPGVNDPNTARAILPQLGDVVIEILARELPATSIELDGRRIVRAASAGYGDYLETAFGQIRRDAADQPVVLLTLARTLVTIGAELLRRGRDGTEALDALCAQLARIDPGQRPADPALAAISDLLERTPWYSGATARTDPGIA